MKYLVTVAIVLACLVLLGLYFGLSRGYLGLKDIIEGPRARAKAMLIPSIFALVVVHIFLKLYLG
jgi:hypothetical protein